MGKKICNFTLISKWSSEIRFLDTHSEIFEGKIQKIQKSTFPIGEAS
jgi:hypothetical protein